MEFYNETKEEFNFDAGWHCGVILKSRYKKLHELDIMAKVVDAVPDAAGYIKSIWCDSKGCCFWEVFYNSKCPKHLMKHLSEQISNAFIEIDNGYNGLTVLDEDGKTISEFDCYWDE